jgi:hypothetical protein
MLKKLAARSQVVGPSIKKNVVFVSGTGVVMVMVSISQSVHGLPNGTV